MDEKEQRAIFSKCEVVKTKQKPLLPSLKEKKRYIVYEIMADIQFKFPQVKEVIDNKCLEFLGQLGYGKAGIMHLNIFEKNKGILKINNKYINEVKTSLALIKTINNHKVIMKIIGISGILNKAKLKYFKEGGD